MRRVITATCAPLSACSWKCLPSQIASMRLLTARAANLGAKSVGFTPSVFSFSMASGVSVMRCSLPLAARLVSRAFSISVS